MSKFATAVRRFVRDETGATMAEYALLIAAVALIGLAGAKVLGTNLKTSLNTAATKVKTP